MPQAVWVGDISFGLVNIPVKLYSATASKRVRFHQYEAGTGRRIRYARVAAGPAPEQPPPPPPEGETEQEAPRGAEPIEESVAAMPADRPREETGAAMPAEPGDDTEVPWEEVVRGYEIEPGRVVTVTPEELDSIAPERSRQVEVERFVDLSDIDPVYFEKSYYVVPQAGRGTERPYWLLFRAMEAEGKVAVGRFVMRTKEYLAAIRPAEHVLMLETVFYADEVRDPKEVWFPLVEEPSERELSVARHLVEALDGEWEPARHRDRYRDQLLDLLHSKAEDALVLPQPDEVPATDTVTDLMKALEASVEAAKQSRIDEQRRSG